MPLKCYLFYLHHMASICLHLGHFQEICTQLSNFVLHLINCIRILEPVTLLNTIHGYEPGRLKGIGEKDIYFRGTWELRSNFEGNRGTKTISWNSEHKKTSFRFLGKKVTDTPGRVSIIFCSKCLNINDNFLILLKI